MPPLSQSFVLENELGAIAFPASFPITAGQVCVALADGRRVCDLSVDQFVGLFLLPRTISSQLESAVSGNRVGLASDGRITNLIPMHGISKEWKPILHTDEDPFHPTHPGFFTSKNGPKMSNAELAAIQARIVAVSGLVTPFNVSFKGDESDTNLFAHIVRGELEQWRVWEDDDHVAFLTPFPNTPGFTVLVPRQHLSSDIFSLSDGDYTSLMRASHTVMHILRRAFKIDTVGVFFEGFEIDYAHVKLIPAHPGSDSDFTTVSSAPYFDLYPGYLTTQPGPPADPSSLDDLSRILRQRLT